MNRTPEIARFHAAERWLIKQLRRAIDRADEILHRWEVAARGNAAPVIQEIDGQVHCVADKTGNRLALEEGSRDFARYSPRQFAIRRLRKKRRMTAAEFDLDIRMRTAARAGAR
jgi:hypothetical protein